MINSDDYIKALLNDDLIAFKQFVPLDELSDISIGKLFDCDDASLNEDKINHNLLQIICFLSGKRSSVLDYIITNVLPRIAVRFQRRFNKLIELSHTCIDELSDIDIDMYQHELQCLVVSKRDEVDELYRLKRRLNRINKPLIVFYRGCWGPINFAAFLGRSNCVQWYYDCCDNVIDSHFYIIMFLNLATIGGQTQVVKTLLNLNVDFPQIFNLTWFSALHCATKHQYIDIIQALIAAGVDVNRKNPIGATALCYAAYHGHDAVAQLLINAGADTELADLKAYTPLHLAAGHGKKNVVVTLLRAGAHRDARNEDGHTPLHLAASYGHADVVQALLNPGIELNFSSLLGFFYMLFHFLISFKLFTRTDNYLDMCDHKGRTALHAASSRGDEDIVGMLLETGADVTLKNQEGGAALHFAAYNGHVTVIDRLLSHASMIDEQDNYGDTALHFSVRNNHIELMRTLVHAGANCTIQSNQYSPIQEIIKDDKLELINAFVDAIKYDFMKHKINVESLIKVAIQHSSLNALNFLIKNILISKFHTEASLLELINCFDEIRTLPNFNEETLQVLTNTIYLYQVIERGDFDIVNELFKNNTTIALNVRLLGGNTFLHRLVEVFADRHKQLRSLIGVMRRDPYNAELRKNDAGCYPKKLRPLFGSAYSNECEAIMTHTRVKLIESLFKRELTLPNGLYLSAKRALPNQSTLNYKLMPTDIIKLLEFELGILQEQVGQKLYMFFPEQLQQVQSLLSHYCDNQSVERDTYAKLSMEQENQIHRVIYSIQKLNRRLILSSMSSQDNTTKSNNKNMLYVNSGFLHYHPEIKPMKKHDKVKTKHQYRHRFFTFDPKVESVTQHCYTR